MNYLFKPKFVVKEFLFLIQIVRCLIDLSETLGDGKTFRFWFYHNQVIKKLIRNATQKFD